MSILSQAKVSILFYSILFYSIALSVKAVTILGNRSLNKNMFLIFQVPRKLNLHPHVVEHLLTLGLSPPSTAADIPKVLEDLQEKKVGALTNYYHLNYLQPMYTFVVPQF